MQTDMDTSSNDSGQHETRASGSFMPVSTARLPQSGIPQDVAVGQWRLRVAVGGAPKRGMGVERAEDNLRCFGDDTCLVVPYHGAPGGSDVLLVQVNDGVGGYATRCDAGEMPRALARETLAIVREEGYVPPLELMERTYSRVLSIVPLGGTTCTMMEFVTPSCDVPGTSGATAGPSQGSGSTHSGDDMDAGEPCSLRLVTHTLGDSSFVVIRGGQVVAAQIPRTGPGGAPLQLAVPPLGCSDEERLNWTDFPKDGDGLDMALQHDDIVVVATDGLWDNLPRRSPRGRPMAGLSLAMLLMGGVPPRFGDDPEREWRELADECARLVNEAASGGESGMETGPSATSPSSRVASAVCKALVSAATRAMYAPGGKPDDIGVAVAVVKRSPSSAA